MLTRLLAIFVLAIASVPAMAENDGAALSPGQGDGGPIIVIHAGRLVVDAGHPARYRAINWGEFRSRRTAGDYANAGEYAQISQYCFSRQGSR